jgi:deazaflavin-dependent oxidoreductase (nitroreductase family)
VDERKRTRNPFINSATGGRILSAMQLPAFLIRPPNGYGVLTTTGRRTGRTRRRCVRVVARDGLAYLVAIKGSRTGWLRNAQATPKVRLRIRGGSYAGRARALLATETAEAIEAYCELLTSFEYLEYRMWRSDRPTPERIRALHRTWFEQGTPLVIELS